MNTITRTDTIEALPVMEHFLTIQGEGHHQGKPAYFIRLGGCDVGCVWCDVKESWDASSHPLISIDQLIESVRQHMKAGIVVITGGEPLMHDLTSLTAALKQAGYQTHLETSGAHPLTGQWDWICLSPKKFKAAKPAVFKQAHELKVVVFNKHDFAWAEELASQVSESCLKFLQPEWEKSAIINPLLIDYIQHHSSWSLSIQIHKYLQIP
jgi:7-carboxy-7-deazaguanine synthase